MNGTRRACVVVSALAGLAWIAVAAHGQAPSIASLAPLGVRPGQVQDVMVRGGNLAGATQFWTSFPSQNVLTPAKPDNGKNAGEVSYRVTVPPHTPLGIYGARVATAKGISSLRMLLVDDLPAIAQQAGNTAPAAAQVVSLPAAIDGSIDALARHYYKFRVEAGQRLSFEIFARRIGSPLDPMLRLLDVSGREIAYSDDAPGLSEDSQIDHTFAKAGEYLLEVSDIRYLGGGYFYRLRIGDFPGAALSTPLCATRGSETTFRFFTEGGGDVEPAIVKTPSDPTLLTIGIPAKFAAGSSRSFATVLLSDRKQLSETEPNNDLKSANRVEVGAGLNGRLDGPKDVDRYVFAGKAGQSLRFESITRRLGSPADLVLRLTKADGTQLGQAEGNGPNEASLAAALPADGDYVLEVRDLNYYGGSRYVYHVDVISSPAPIALSASTDALNVPSGGAAIVTVEAARNGYDGPIAITARNLPPGVTSVPTVIGAGQKSVVLTVRSAADAQTGQVHSIQIVGSARVGSTDVQATTDVVEPLKTHFHGMPYPPLALASATALGIAPRAPFVLRTEPTELVFGRELSTTIKVIAERQAGYDEEIALAVVPPEGDPKPPKHPLPPGINAALKPIAKGASSVEITFTADKTAPLSEFTAVLNGTLKKGSETITQPVPGIGLKIDVPFRLSVGAVAGKLPRKGEFKLKVAAIRNPAFKGEIAIAASKLPEGVTAAPAKIPAGANEAEIVVAATAAAQPGPIKSVAIRGDAKVGSGNYSTSVPLGELSVD